VVLDGQRARCTGDDGARHDPDAVDRDRLRTRVPELVEEVLDAIAADRAGDEDRDALAGHRGQPRPRPDPRQIGTEVADGGLAAVVGILQLLLLATEVAELVAKL